MKLIKQILLLVSFLSLSNLSYSQEDVTSEIKEQIPICDANDPTYKKVGGRNICKRECRIDEIGPSGKLCETKKETANDDIFCDCGV